MTTTTIRPEIAGCLSLAERHERIARRGNCPCRCCRRRHERQAARLRAKARRLGWQGDS